MILAITDPRYPLEHLLGAIQRAHAAIGGRLLVEYRNKAATPDQRASEMRTLRASGARMIVNGRPDEALALGAYGVHLAGPSPDVREAREALGPDAWISISAHDDAAIERAVALGATAALVSPIFETPGKGAPRGIEALTRAREIAGDRLRIFALGGIDSRRAASCARAGADGIAVIRAIFDAPDPAAAALELSELTHRP